MSLIRTISVSPTARSHSPLVVGRPAPSNGSVAFQQAAVSLAQLAEGRSARLEAHNFSNRLEAAILHRQGGEDFARRAGDLLPKAARDIFLTEIEERVLIFPDQVHRLSNSLGIGPEEAYKIIDQWQWVFHVGSFYVAEAEWGKFLVSLRPLIYQRLRDAFIEGAHLHPYFVASALALHAPSNHPALETFHNVVMGSGRDLPRFFVNDLATQLGIPEKHEQVRGWELFWEGQANLWMWEIKPISHSPVGDLLGALEYARFMGWSLLKVRDWLKDWQERKADSKMRGPALEVFDLVLDTNVLEGVCATPQPRPRAIDVAKQMGDPLFRTYLTHWEPEWESLARDLGEERAIRPVSSARLQFAASRKLAALRNKILREALSEQPTVQQLHQTLLENGLIDDAQILANVCEGIDQNKRRSPYHMKPQQVSHPVLSKLERNYEALAKKLGYPIKPVSEETLMHREQHQKRRYLRDVERRVIEEDWDIEELAAWVRNGTFQPVFGFDGSLIAEILIARKRKGKEIEKLKTGYRRDFLDTGESKDAFEEWWKRTERWMSLL